MFGLVFSWPLCLQEVLVEGAEARVDIVIELLVELRVRLLALLGVLHAQTNHKHTRRKKKDVAVEERRSTANFMPERRLRISLVCCLT